LKVWYHWMWWLFFNIQYIFNAQKSLLKINFTCFFNFSLLILKKQTTHHHISIPNTFRAKLSIDKKNKERKKAINVAEPGNAARRRLWRISLKKGLKFVNGSPSRKDKYKYWPTKWRCHDIYKLAWSELHKFTGGE
jgi:hypothetical protein